jgi:hypothetical protein
MKTIKYWEQIELMERDGGEIVDLRNNSDFYRAEAVRELENMEEGRHYYHPATRNSHYTALNCLPVVVGTRWTVSEEVYFEFLECLPPISRKGGGFYISEASCGSPNGKNIRSAYYPSGELFWHEYEETAF